MAKTRRMKWRRPVESNLRCGPLCLETYLPYSSQNSFWDCYGSFDAFFRISRNPGPGKLSISQKSFGMNMAFERLSRAPRSQNYSFQKIPNNTSIKNKIGPHVWRCLCTRCLLVYESHSLVLALTPDYRGYHTLQHVGIWLSKKLKPWVFKLLVKRMFSYATCTVKCLFEPSGIHIWCSRRKS